MRLKFYVFIYITLSYSEINGTITFYENTGTQYPYMNCFQETSSSFIITFT